MNDKFVIVTFFTEKYRKFVDAWRQSISQHGIMSIAYPEVDTQNWYLNIFNKPKVILESLDNVGGKDVVWCDVDAKMLRYPDLFDGIETDIAGYRVNPDKNWVRKFVDEHYVWKNYDVVYTGTVYFKNNDKVRALLNDWMDYLVSDEWAARATSGVKAIGDQDSFNHLIRQSDISITDLPESYCWIERKNKYENALSDVVFMHYIEGARNSDYVGKRL